MDERTIKALGTLYVAFWAVEIAQDPKLKPLLREKSVKLVHQSFKIMWNREARVPSEHYSDQRNQVALMIKYLLTPGCFSADMDL